MKSYWLTFQVNLCFPLFCNFRKKVPRPKWTIYKHKSDKNKKCVSVGNFKILSVTCSASAAYTSLCRGLKYLLKVGYIILDNLNLARFLISNTVFCCKMETLPNA